MKEKDLVLMKDVCWKDIIMIRYWFVRDLRAH